MRYHAKRLVAFIDTRTVIDPEDRSRWVNGVRMNTKDLRALYRWRESAQTVDLGDADAFLMRHDLMIWDYELWARAAGLYPFAKDNRHRPPRPARRRSSSPVSG